MAKKRAAYKERKKQKDEEEMKNYLKENVHKQVQKNDKDYFKFTKELSIQRAIESIQMIEEMSKKNDQIQTRFLKNTVVNNILDRKKELNIKFKKNKEYWALQLLQKLGLLEDYEGAPEDGDESEMSE